MGQVKANNHCVGGYLKLDAAQPKKLNVFHDDREIEFIQFSRWLQRLFSENVMTLDYKSCEMIADEMFLEIRTKYGSNREVHIEVSEDGENGCVVTFPKA